MLHEILLSLSGHPSPLLTADHTSPTSIFSPPEKALLASVAHLSTLHRKLLTSTSLIASSHPSSICQAVATAISSYHLARFQRKILEVEEGILRKDAGSVGAYNIVPLTAVVGEFSGWTRRMEWFVEVVEYMTRGAGGEKKCTGAMIIDKLCKAMQTGYVDIEEAALSLVKIAETAWLKQVSAWILYGRLPSFGREDFFVQEVEGPDYESKRELLPAFVTPSTTASLLFIGRSLNHIRVKGTSSTTSLELNILSAHLKQLSALTFPINIANFSRVIASIRLSLSQTTLQKLLPLSKVVEILSLLREFFLLGRGEFAIALIQEADEKIRSRWRRSNNIGYEKQSGIGNIVVKEGEVSSALARTWAAMSSLQSSHEDSEEDELLELARDLVQLTIFKQASTPSKASTLIASTPFSNLLLSVPVSLTLTIPSPLDLFLSPQDINIYTSINAYLLSIHRAHLRLTDLWKITSLRREYPAPPGPPYGSTVVGRAQVMILRKRSKERAEAMRSIWATGSAAVFFLAETQAYLQGEVVQGSWDGFKTWLVGEEMSATKPVAMANTDISNSKEEEEKQDEEEDVWLRAAATEEPNPQSESTTTKPTHDPQTLSTAHATYLTYLTHSLLLTHPTFTQPLYNLLQSIDHLVALIHRIHSIWTSLDLEADEGVVDAFSDFAKEEADVRAQMKEVSGRVKEGIWRVMGSLRELDARGDEGVGGNGVQVEAGFVEEEAEWKYVPRKVGRVDRLLMKLDFGGWFDDCDEKKTGGSTGSVEGSDDDDDE